MPRLIVGLGNPGEKYIYTRHNAGFIFLDKLVHILDIRWAYQKKFDSVISKKDDIYFVKPQTFMNKSGIAVSGLLRYFDINIDELLVVHDDVDLEPLTSKLVNNRGSAGHKGVQNIIENIRSQDFWRLRIGIGRPQNETFDIEEYVLGQLSEEQLHYIKSLELPETFHL